MKFILKWRNKYSNETGYVESISAKERCFINTFNEADAKRYSSMSIVNRMLTSLRSYGECENNDFEVISV